MPHFDIVKHNQIDKKSFRVSQLYDQFDLQENSFDERFCGDFELPEIWNVGIIVGKSGTGKSTIVRELFGDQSAGFEYSHACVIDDFDKKIPAGDLFALLSQVGFSSPPSWLKPYQVLSNGEKMRVDLARAIMQDKDIIVFDEYTSVVDREVAKIGSLAVQKAIRRMNKKFIAVTCHYDVIDWLQPDFIFSTDDFSMRYTRGLVQQPEIKLDIYETKGYWEMFRRYHYLSHDLNKAAHQYVAFLNETPVAFCAVLNFPHSHIRPMWKIHRIVVLPDYQGVGIASRFMDFIGNIYNERHQYFGITTSLNGFAKALMKNRNWVLIRAGRTDANSRIKTLNKTISSHRNTYSFRYAPNVKKLI